MITIGKTVPKALPPGRDHLQASRENHDVFDAIVRGKQDEIVAQRQGVVAEDDRAKTRFGK